MSAPRTIPVADVHVEPELNARDSLGDLDALAASIERHGILQPLIVRPRDEGGVWLVAGHRRLAAACKAGLEDVPVCEPEGERLELTAIENLQRSELNPLEEARAYGALREAGYSKRGIAQALSVAPRRVTERLAILELTEEGQRAVAESRLALSAVPRLVELGALSAELADRVLEHAGSNGGAAQLATDPGWLIQRAVGFDSDEQAACGWAPTGRGFPVCRLDLPEDLAAKVGEIDATRGWPLGLVIDGELIEQAQAAKCAWVDERGYGVVSLVWLAEQAPPLVEAEWERLKAERQATAEQTGGGEASAADPLKAEERERETRAEERRQAAEDRARARAVNDELGAKLLKGLASHAWDNDAATFVAHTLLGRTGEYGTLSNTARLAAQGLRYILPEFRELEPATKEGGEAKVRYPDARECERRFWDWFDRAATPEEILGRTLIAYVAATWAREEAVAQSDRQGRFRPSPQAVKAFERIARRHLPASLKKFAAELAERP